MSLSPAIRASTVTHRYRKEQAAGYTESILFRILSYAARLTHIPTFQHSQSGYMYVTDLTEHMPCTVVQVSGPLAASQFQIPMFQTISISRKSRVAPVATRAILSVSSYRPLLVFIFFSKPPDTRFSTHWTSPHQQGTLDRTLLAAFKKIRPPLAF